jgi:hypothetical protein
MLKGIELGLFSLATALYLAAWAWHLRGWKQSVDGLGPARRHGWPALVPGRACADAKCLRVRDLLRDAGHRLFLAFRDQRTQPDARRVSRAGRAAFDALRGLHAQGHRTGTVDLQGNAATRWPTAPHSSRSRF